MVPWRTTKNKSTILFFLPSGHVNSINIILAHRNVSCSSDRKCHSRQSRDFTLTIAQCLLSENIILSILGSINI